VRVMRFAIEFSKFDRGLSRKASKFTRPKSCLSNRLAPNQVDRGSFLPSLREPRNLRDSLNVRFLSGKFRVQYPHIDRLLKAQLWTGIVSKYDP
jgi:hypothetical protein